MAARGLLNGKASSMTDKYSQHNDSNMPKKCDFVDTSRLEMVLRGMQETNRRYFWSVYPVYQ